MVSQTARRRITTISGHFGAGLLAQDITTSTNLFPSSCNSNASTQFRRLDNRLQYGRQATASQGFFMRQSDNSVNLDVTSKSDINEKNSSDAATTPLFSRLGYGVPQFAKPRAELDCFPKMSPETLCPKFDETSERKLSTQRPLVFSQINEGKQWSPRINVAESKCSYVIAVELPGVEIRDIRVEMDDKNLIVRGKRSAKWWKATGCSNDAGLTYHKREISQGQYQDVWPLPANANKNSISAEFVEGILEIAISKL